MKTADALRHVMNALWEHDHEYSDRLSFCGRCEADGGKPDRTAHWEEVPHEKDCLYAVAAEGMKDEGGTGL